MLELRIDVRPLVKRLEKRLTALQKDQLPFATALALTRTAQKVQGGEKDNLKSVFPTVTPFTQRGVAIKPARKDDLDAVVFLKDIQAVYLAPYENQGKSVPAKPGNVAMLVPKAISINQYGNIPYQKVKKLLGNKSKYFIGTVKTAGGGPVTGLWERLPKGRVIGKRVTFKSGTAKAGRNIRGGPSLRLLMRFSDPRQVKQHLDWYAMAKKIVSQNFTLELKKALRTALASAR